MDVAIMIEGQSGVTWPIWQRVAAAVERLGFAGLYRSDHFTDAEPPSSDALEAWVSLTWLASHTQRIEFGPLVSPVSFREPVMLARTALAVDDLSGGRLQFGLGAGWQTREHSMFGYSLLGTTERMARFGEALEVVSLLLRGDAPASFEGKYYTLREATLLPRPRRPGGPPIVIGGNGPKYTLPLAARYAQEWNAVYVTPQRFGELQAQLDALIADAGRAPGDVRRTLMTGMVFGRDDAELRQRAAEWGGTPAELRQRGIVAGTAPDLAEQLHAIAAAGAQRVMLQWFGWDDMAELEAIAAAVLPAFPPAPR
ncbi:TIGR03560 family F420-dependent LLM class oxidoreductase [Kouleothrix sp.]|uniref:TIGR03560 family F420-dependent LLM class oxidoreductase n=1 Tax=Kouleothrix sp. TaxID=2779161 RepID=UPI003919A255